MTRERLVELAGLFFRLGTTAFGGPAAHIAMMEEEVVRRRRWLTPEEFLDLLGAANLIPGPNSTELAIHIGHRRAGWPGLLVAGSCFIAPASAITLALAWAYVRYGQVPHASGLLYGIKPVMIAIVAQALFGLGRSAVKSRRLAGLGLGALGAAALGVDELVVLFASGLVALLLHRDGKAHAFALGGVWWGATAPAAPSSSSLFLLFAKIGSVLFGSGYVLLAFLREELVTRRSWMTEAQLLDAIAVGQITPGPVFTSATFIGFVLHGFHGAAAATLGIFLPAFVFVALSGWLVPKLRASKRASAFLDGVNIASLALMAVVGAQLARAALVDGLSLALAVGSAVLLLRFQIGSLWLVLGGGAIGLASH